MEGHRRSTAALILVVLAAVLLARSAAALEAVRADAETNGNGIDTSISVRQGAARVAAAASRGRDWDCTWQSAPYLGSGPDGRNDVSLDIGPAPAPGAQLYIAWCGDIQAFFWLNPNGQVAAVNAAEALAGEVRDRMELEAGAIGVRPDTRGVTGITSYFWVDGAEDDMEESTRAFGVDVTVWARLTDVSWDFGDRTRNDMRGLGEPWPAESSVRHTYRDPSPEGGYRVRVTLAYETRFAASNGENGDLDPIVLTFERRYTVHEVQAVRQR